MPSSLDVSAQVAPGEQAPDDPSGATRAELADELISARRRIAELERQVEAQNAELRAIETTLQLANEYLRDLLGAVSDALLVVDDAQIILTANRAALQLLGYEDHELLGEELRVVAPDIHVEVAGTASGLDAVARRSDLVLRTREGEPIPVLFAISRLQDAYGDVVHVCAATDMRERLRLESELHHAQRLESLGQLSAGVAHEINNPLSYLIGNLEYLSDELPEALWAEQPEARAAFEQACEGAHRVREVVADLLSFARTSADELHSVDVHRVLESTLRLVGGQLKRRAQLRREIAPVPSVRAQHARLGQVFLNLIMNAIQALPEDKSGNWIRIRTIVGDEYVVVEIADNGPGIAPEVRSRIFEPFFTTKPSGVGTGLGLSICHGIIKRFGGHIALDTEMGRGTAFSVHLRIAE